MIKYDCKNDYANNLLFTFVPYIEKYTSSRNNIL